MLFKVTVDRDSGGGKWIGGVIIYDVLSVLSEFLSHMVQIGY